MLKYLILLTVFAVALAMPAAEDARARRHVIYSHGGGYEGYERSYPMGYGGFGSGGYLQRGLGGYGGYPYVGYNQGYNQGYYGYGGVPYQGYYGVY